MDGRSSLLGGAVTPTRMSEDVFADEFEVDGFDMVADGFRPMRNTEVEEAKEQDDEDDFDDLHDAPIRSPSLRFAPDTISHTSPFQQRRESIRKSTSVENPFASHEDEDDQSMLTFEPNHPSHRSVSSASSHIFARSSSPRMTSGPSHPYGMYPQGTLARTASTATTSTVRTPQRPSTDYQRGSQHPYALYPQDMEEDDDEEHTPHNFVPVGFPGLARRFNRQRGPDGEEQDIIGADGHTEQLPPYTRYPEDGPEKGPLLGAPVLPTPLHSRPPVAGSDPGMSLMHHPLQPTPHGEPQSMSDGSTLARQETQRSINRSTTTNESGASVKTWREKSWKEKRKHRVFGIPVWCYILAASVTGFIAAVLGGVIGGFVMGAQHNNKHTVNQSTGSSLFDVSAIATPTIAPPPTGTYALSMSTPQATQAACLTSPDQQVAWSCDLSDAPGVAIVVGWNTTTSALGARLMYASSSTQLSFGSQLSWLQTEFSPFLTVTDTDSPGSGPAYYFESYYDKLVVLPELALNSSSGSGSKKNKAKRQGIYLDTSWLIEETIPKPGDRPWFCVWNNTYLEGLIYIQETPNPTFTTTSKPLMSGGSLATATSTTSLLNSALSTLSPVATATATATSQSGVYTISNAYTTATFSKTSGEFPWTSGAPDHDGDDDDAYETRGSQGTNKGKRQNEADLYASLQLYPYVVKIEERRVSGNTVNPYCQQYQILDNNKYGAVTDENGNPIIVSLDETDPAHSAYATSTSQLVDGECHCQWMSGQ